MAAKKCANTACEREHQHVHVNARTASSADELIVVGHGPNTYLWIGRGGECVAHAGGPAMLRKLQKAIGRALRQGGK